MTPSSLVLQSFPLPCQNPWIQTCLNSVKSWAQANHYDYALLGDELFDTLPQSIREKTINQTVIATDLARLIALQNALKIGYDTVIWCDADFLIFNPQAMVIPNKFQLPEGYALGREVWVQSKCQNYDHTAIKSNNMKLVAYKKVHNAFMVFQKENDFLDFYTSNAQRLLEKNSGNIPPQFIGPKLLTALHNVVQCPVIENAGMLCPLVIDDLLNIKKAVVHNTRSKTQPQRALKLFHQRSTVPLAGANLCHSLTHADDATNTHLSTRDIEHRMTQLTKILLADQGIAAINPRRSDPEQPAKISARDRRRSCKI